jgi:hypothetical protein
VHGDLLRRRDLVTGARLLAVVDDDDVFQVGQVVDDCGDAIRERALDHDDPRARVPELVPQVLTLVRGVDRHRDRAAADRSPPRQQPFG